MGIRSLQHAMKGINVGFHSSTGEEDELAWDICSRSNDCKVEGKAANVRPHLLSMPKCLGVH